MQARIPKLLAATVALLAALALFAGPASAKRHHDAVKPTIVLVHGAWADASSWNRVIRRLTADGYTVQAPANPLRSLSGDSAYVANFLSQIPGPLVVVGHSYGGAVITNAAAGNANVKALVYVDAFIPDVGEQVLNLGGAGSQVPASIETRPIPPFGPTDVDIYLKRDMFRSTFAADLPLRKTNVMAVTQRPLALAAGVEPTTATAWSTIPSWAVVGLEDKAITPDAQLAMATRAHARITKIHSSHVSLLSHPDVVTRVIERAARATG